MPLAIDHLEGPRLVGGSVVVADRGGDHPPIGLRRRGQPVRLVDLDGELTESKRTQIREHLDDCSPCLEAFDFEAELRIVIKHRCRDEVPESLRDRVAEKLASFDLSAAAGDPVDVADSSGDASR